MESAYGPRPAQLTDTTFLAADQTMPIRLGPDELGTLAGPRHIYWGFPPGPWPPAPGVEPNHATPTNGGWGFGAVGDVWLLPEQWTDPYWPQGAYDLLSLMNTLRKLFTSGDLPNLLPPEHVPGILWLVPDAPGTYVDGSGMSLTVVRCGVHAKLGTLEELIHQFHLIGVRNGATVPSDAAGLIALGEDLAGIWHTFFTTAVGIQNQTEPPSYFFAPELVYDELRLSVVEYLQVTSPTAPRPNPVVHIPTQYVAIPSGTVGTSAAPALPYEVACCVTHLTNARGRSNKGRVYFGGLSTTCLTTTGGLFYSVAEQINLPGYLGQAYGENWIQAVTSGTDYDLQVVSSRSHVGNQGPKNPNGEGAWAAPGSKGIGGVKIGAVPDAQRRRRRNQLEQYVLEWGTAP